MALVLDTGPVVAALNRSDPQHGACAALLLTGTEDLVVPSPVLVEVDYWLRKLGGQDAWGAFVDDIADGVYRVHHLDQQDLTRAVDLEMTYADLRLGLVDAAVLATCERLGETKVATLDRRHFTVVRLAHCPVLEILPG